jgi:hypothetical protein
MKRVERSKGRGSKKKEIKEMICRGTGKISHRSNMPDGLNQGYLLWKENRMEYSLEDHSSPLSEGHAGRGANVTFLACYGQAYPSKLDLRVNAPAYTDRVNSADQERTVYGASQPHPRM